MMSRFNQTINMHMKIKFLMLISFIVLLMAGCGFKLRGSIDLPYKLAYVSGTMSADLRQNLVRSIEVGTNVKITPNPRQADLLIDILQDQTSKQILSYNGAGQITAYRIVALIKFRVLDALGNEIIPESDVFMTRDMDFSISTVLASENLEQELVASMRMDLTNQILRRISALSKNKAVVPTAN